MPSDREFRDWTDVSARSRDWIEKIRRQKLYDRVWKGEHPQCTICKAKLLEYIAQCEEGVCSFDEF